MIICSTFHAWLCNFVGRVDCDEPGPVQLYTASGWYFEKISFPGLDWARLG